MSAATPLPRLAGRVALAAFAFSGASALLVWALGAGHHARQLLGLNLGSRARDPGGVVEIAATNLRLAGAGLLAAFAVRHRPQLRPPLDVTLALLLALNMAALGAALAGYGTQLLAAIALHGPLELAAFAIVGGAYLTARASQLSTGALAAAAALAIAILAAAAVLEAQVETGGGR